MSVVSTNKTDRHDITGILLKVALNTIKLTFFSPVVVFQLSVPIAKHPMLNAKSLN
jgi:hypothetical protein